MEKLPNLPPLMDPPANYLNRKLATLQSKSRTCPMDTNFVLLRKHVNLIIQIGLASKYTNLPP